MRAGVRGVTRPRRSPRRSGVGTGGRWRTGGWGRIQDGRTIEGYAFALGYIALLFIWIGTEPFLAGSTVAVDQAGGGSRVRQAVLVALAGCAVPVLLIWRDTARRVVFSNPAVLLMLVWMTLSVGWSMAPSITGRRVAGAVVVGLLCLLVLCLPAKRRMDLLLAVSGSVMAINFAGVAVAPELSIDHKGMWEGLHAHKNIAGYSSAVSAVIWLSLAYARQRLALGGVGLLWVIFLGLTQSRTAAAAFGVVACAAPMLAMALKRRTFWPLVAWGLTGLALGASAVLALIVIEGTWGGPLLDWSFTGRTLIWSYVWEEIIRRPFLGAGYASFWAIGDQSRPLRYASDFVAQYSEAHSGYLDLAVTLGLIGLVIAFAVFAHAFAGLVDRWAVEASEWEAALFAYCLLTFAVAHNLLETSLFQGQNPLWATTLIALWTASDRAGRCRSGTRRLGGRRGCGRAVPWRERHLQVRERR